MKLSIAAQYVIRLVLGGLFIFSGVIKMNDPLGFSYKLEEYFGADVLNLEFLQPLALPMAIFLVAFEVVLGLLMLLGAKTRPPSGLPTRNLTGWWPMILNDQTWSSSSAFARKCKKCMTEAFPW